MFSSTRSTPADRRLAYALLGESLVGLRRWREAREALTTALEIARQTEASAISHALIELQLARAEASAGEHARALIRARAAHEVFAAAPGEPRALRTANQLIAELSQRRGQR